MPQSPVKNLKKSKAHGKTRSKTPKRSKTHTKIRSNTRGKTRSKTRSKIPSHSPVNDLKQNKTPSHSPVNDPKQNKTPSHSPVNDVMQSKLDKILLKARSKTATWSTEMHNGKHTGNIDEIRHETQLMSPTRVAELNNGTTPDENERILVQHALGDRSTSVNCPTCNTLYMKEGGCYYVQCAIQSCGTWFCFHCGQVVDSMGHYGISKRCSLGATDLYRASYILRMFLNTGVIGIIILSPAIIYASLVLLPIAVVVRFTYKIVLKLTANFNQLASAILKIVVFLPVLLLGLLLGALSIFGGLVIVMLYVLFLFIRFIPISMTLNAILKMLPGIAKMFGVDSIENLISDAQEARILLEIEAYQMKREKEKLIDEELMTKSQALEARVRREDHDARYARSMGLDKLKGGDINVANAVEKVNQNIVALKEGRLKDVKVDRIANVKFSGSGVIKKAIKYGTS